MNSYKKWKELHESFGPGGFTLGISQPQNMGLNSQFGIGEAKKKEKDDDVEVDVDGDDGWEEMEDDVKKEGGCGCGSKSSKKSSKKSAKKSAKHMDSDMGGDFEDDDGEDHDDDDDKDDDKGGDEGGDEDEGGEDDDKGGDEDEDGEGDKSSDAAGGAPLFSKKKAAKKSAKKSSKKSAKKSAKKMHKESVAANPTAKEEWWKTSDAEWMKSVQSMLGEKADLTKNKDGWSEYQEDSLFPANDPNANVSSDPKPGEVGFAPTGRLNNLGSDISLGEAVKVLEEAVERAGPKLQKKLIKKLAQLHNRLI